MIYSLIAFSLFAVQAAPEVPAAPEAEPAAQAKAEPTADPNIDVVEQKPEKITDRSHPDYVRCKSKPVIGSRAQRKRTCMTNREWAEVARQGNDRSRDFVGDNQPGFQRIPGQN
ncbi:MAG: hypothetical protein QNI87_15070 [Erythrobacter sp.]|uniref:hypothetical protein n=1 Tax=Erythrobacter sp. TaxID=1042 RepID=UPI002625CB97|nr:hypothetical protein [Erythrobacter sp.]MDJ0979845.1 hypothetical protein [Erythrobacter sp.]